MFMIPDLNFDIITNLDRMHNLHLIILKLHKIKLTQIRRSFHHTIV